MRVTPLAALIALSFHGLCLAQARRTPAVSLAEARRGFTTALREQTSAPASLDAPPAPLALVGYPSPKGTLRGWQCSAPAGSRNQPALIWLSGGFPGGGMDTGTWRNQDPSVAESARQYC